MSNVGFEQNIRGLQPPDYIILYDTWRKKNGVFIVKVRNSQ